MEKQKTNPAADKVKELLDKLEAGVKDVFESEQYKAYLKAMAKFHSYSFGNVMLILLQCPNASLVAGFHKWKKDFGRTVKKGEHGIQILAPCPHKRFVEQEVEKPDGTKEKESVLIVQQGFKVAYVFDVSQTEGRELPSFGVDKLTGDVQHYDEFYKAIESVAPVPIEFRPATEHSEGCYKHKEQKIYINEGLSQIQTVSVMIHETAHAILHALPVENGKIVGKPEKDRRTREVEAESVAYIVCQHFGIETGESSFAYVTSWSKNKELPELKASLECISKTASKMIEDIENNCPSICKTMEKATVTRESIER